MVMGLYRNPNEIVALKLQALHTVDHCPSLTWLSSAAVTWDKAGMIDNAKGI